MNSSTPPRNSPSGAPRPLQAATSLWLLTVPVCLTLGLLGLLSLVTLAQDPPLTAEVAGAGEARALIAVIGVVTAAGRVGFAAVALAYGFALRRAGTSGRRARSTLTVLAALGVTATTISYLAAGTVPFTPAQSALALLHDALEMLWLLAALSATALGFTRAARRHLQRQPS